MPKKSMLLAIALLAVVGTASSEALRDPTRPDGWRTAANGATASTVNPSARMHLQGIFNRGGVRTAMISGQHVAVGDRVAGNEVVRISTDKVTLAVDGAMVELPVRSDTVKRSSEAVEVWR